MTPADPVALVVGQGDALHCAVARRLASDGGYVVAAAFEPSRAQRVHEAVVDLAAGHSSAEQLDPCSATAAEALVERLHQQLGGLDMFVAISDHYVRSAKAGAGERRAPDRFLHRFHLPLYALVRPVVTDMARKGEGRIVNICRSPIMSVDDEAVALTWAALAGFTRSLALEAGPRGITVNMLSYSYVEQAAPVEGSGNADGARDRRTALRRMGTVEDVAGIVAFLLSRDASYLTGQVLSACGGSSIGRVPL